MKNLLLIVIVLLLITSCSKDKIQQKRMDGIWNVDRLERVYYIDNKPDTVAFFENAGKFQLTYNKESSENVCHFSFGSTDLSGISSLPKWGGTDEGFDCYWDTDEFTEDRIVFWNTSIYLEDPYFFYTRVNRKKNSETWIYVVSNWGEIHHRDILFLTKED